MKKLAPLMLMSALLAACQATHALPGSTATGSMLPNSRLTSLSESPALGSDCSGYDAIFSPNGGKLGLPPAQGYGGYIRYASADGGGGAVFYACPGTDNSLGMPIPKGHTPDWFGEIDFGFSAVYGQADLDGKMSSLLWLADKDYYMYLYDGKYHHVGSYKIGRANVKKSVLKFPTPLQNGLATPADGILYLEITHRTK